jgi:signal transduction histidine kinase
MQVADVVSDVVATLTPQARKKGVELGAQVEDALPELWADADRLRQVLLNLSENAIKFTPPGGLVTVSAAMKWLDSEDLGAAGNVLLLPARRRAVELRVSDTGIGIAEDERPRVFDAFYQVDSSSTREQGGTGLGLSIVKRLVDAHDGDIDIAANGSHGTVFVVTLPVLPEPG